MCILNLVTEDKREERDLYQGQVTVQALVVLPGTKGLEV